MCKSCELCASYVSYVQVMRCASYVSYVQVIGKTEKRKINFKVFFPHFQHFTLPVYYLRKTQGTLRLILELESFRS